MLATGHDEDSIELERSKSDLVKMVRIRMTPYIRSVLPNAAVEGLLQGKTAVRKMSGQVWGKLLQSVSTNKFLGAVLLMINITSQRIPVVC